MPPKSVLPSQEALIKLREGGWSNKDIAEKYGVRPDYISQVIRKGFAQFRGTVKDVDPRDYLPKLRESISDEMVATWRETRTCMCGCGRPVTIRNAPTSGGPRGSYTFFSVGHVNRLKPYNDGLRGRTLSLETRRRISERRRSENEITASMIPIINKMLLDHGMRISEIAMQVNLDPTLISEIRCGTKERISKASYAKFQEGIKEDKINPILIKDMVSEYMFENKMTVKKFASEFDFDPRWLTRILEGKQYWITKVMAAKLLTSIGEPLMPELKKYAPEKSGKRVSRRRVV